MGLICDGTDFYEMDDNKPKFKNPVRTHGLAKCEGCKRIGPKDGLSKDGYCPACLHDVPSESGGENG
jgi:hypothetical protein